MTLIHKRGDSMRKLYMSSLKTIFLKFSCYKIYNFLKRIHLKYSNLVKVAVGWEEEKNLKI